MSVWRYHPTSLGTFGAVPLPSGVSYSVWAPDLASVGVEVETVSGRRRISLSRDEGGIWSGIDPDGLAGDLYWFRLPDGSLVPDVASRFQPRGVFGPSECIDSYSYVWKSPGWRRKPWEGQPTYEVHIGTLTNAGTFLSAMKALPHIKDLGAEAIEIMPVADFAGDRNWGYDGVALFAPARCYGRPDDLRALVDAAHAMGIVVVLDVVYNHVGPQGSHLGRFARNYLRPESPGPWGSGFNVDGEQSSHVRGFLRSNALYWLEEFRFDGLRIDAAHAISDRSEHHILNEIAEAIRSVGAFSIAEDDRNCAALLGGPGGLDALWADDFHHEVRVCMTGDRDGYYSAYSGSPHDIQDTINHGWFFRGQPYCQWKGKPRGTDTAGLPPRAFVYCIENHDQVGNRANGERLEQLVTSEQFRAASLLLCLGPHTPLIFMGQDWAASTPFLFFTDHRGQIGRGVSEGRRREHGHSNAPDPESVQTFERSKLRWEESDAGLHAKVGALYRAALAQRVALQEVGALATEAWKASSHGNLVILEYRVPLGVRVLLTLLREAVGGQTPELYERRGPYTVLLNSNWARFGGAVTDGDQALEFRNAGSIWLEYPSTDGKV